MTDNSETASCRNVLALFNKKSGIGFRTSELFKALSSNWDCTPDINLAYQESKSIEDGRIKVQQAIASGVDTIIVVGGDGMVNSIGSQLVGTDVKLTVLPAGSGNGFAHHFDIPIRMEKAAKALRHGRQIKVDVGYINEYPFFVTASLAWDADLVDGFEKSPIRGVAPYIFAGIYKYFTYEPQNYKLIVDDVEKVIERPLLLTIANLSEYGGGAKIAPNARADDGQMSLVAVPHMEPYELLPQIRRLFDGSINKIPELETFAFREMTIRREREDPVQIDGELIALGKELHVRVMPQALNVIVPEKAGM